jgi:hypothetical protein
MKMASTKATQTSPSETSDARSSPRLFQRLSVHSSHAMGE